MVAADFLTLLVEQLGASPTPQRVVDVLVPEVADLAQVFIRRGAELQLTAFRHIDPRHHPALEELARMHRPRTDHPSDPVAMVYRTGEPHLRTWVRRANVERITTDARVHEIFDEIQPRNIVVVPLARNGERFGAIVAALSVSGRRFIQGDLEFMVEFARRTGLALRVNDFA